MPDLIIDALSASAMREDSRRTAHLPIRDDLVSYLLHYPSARCVTFKELFVCKSSYLIRDFDINSRFLSPHS